MSDQTTIQEDDSTMSSLVETKTSTTQVYSKNRKIQVVPQSKFPLHMQFSTSGNKYIYVSNNISSSIFSGIELNSINQQIVYAKLNNNIEILSSNAFANCTQLKDIDLDSKLKTMCSACFMNCKQLSSIELPDSLEKIEISSFAGCSGLKSVSFQNFESDKE